MRSRQIYFPPHPSPLPARLCDGSAIRRSGDGERQCRNLTTETKRTGCSRITSLASFMVALDTQVLTAALATIRAEFGAPMETLQWTVNAFNLSFAVLLLTGAALGDRFGRRRLFAAGISVVRGVVRRLRAVDRHPLADRGPDRAGRRFGADHAARDGAAEHGISKRRTRPRPRHLQRRRGCGGAGRTGDRRRHHRKPGMAVDLLDQSADRTVRGRHGHDAAAREFRPGGEARYFRPRAGRGFRLRAGLGPVARQRRRMDQPRSGDGARGRIAAGGGFCRLGIADIRADGADAAVPVARAVVRHRRDLPAVRHVVQRAVPAAAIPAVRARLWTARRRPAVAALDRHAVRDRTDRRQHRQPDRRTAAGGGGALDAGDRPVLDRGDHRARYRPMRR